MPRDTDLGPADVLPVDREGATSMAGWVELILAQREALVEARTRDGAQSRRALAHAAILRTLIEKARGTELAAGARSPVETASELANVFLFEPPPAPKGRLAAGARSALLKGLRPFHVELLRPQAEFDRALVEVLRVVLAGAPRGDGDWVRARLQSLASPSSWAVKSHRSNVAGRMVDATKRSYLRAAGAVVAPLLDRQRAWNEAAIDALVSRVKGEPVPVERLRALEDPLAVGAPGKELLWEAVLRRQARFNAYFATLLEGPAAVAPAPPYQTWLRERQARRRAELSGVEGGPRFGVVVVGGAEARTAASLRAQSYRRWSEGATDADWLVFVEGGDELDPLALAELAAGPCRDGADVAYSDEDVAGSVRSEPFFKPDFSYELLTARDYTSRLLAVRRELFERAGGLGRGLHDLSLRCFELGARFQHVPEVLCSRAPGPAVRADRVAVEEHLRRRGARAEVVERPGGLTVRYAPTGAPRVSIIIPFRDKPELLETVTRTLLEKTRYAPFELVLVSNESRQPETRALLERITDPRVVKLEWNHPFNYPAINNWAAKQARGELLLFLNNDIEIVNADWLELLVGHLQQPEIGAVTPKLLFPDRTIQHAGVVVGMTGFAGHVFQGLPDDGRQTLAGSADDARDWLALTSAAVLVRRQLFDELGGFDERFTVCGSDVDLCLRMRERGLRVVHQPASVLIHHESVSRKGSPIPADDFWESLRSYAPYLQHEPCWSPHLSLASTVPALRMEREPAAFDRAIEALAGFELPQRSRLSGGRLTWVRWGQDMARSLDLTEAELRRARTQARLAHPPRTVTWLVPFFEHAFGGVHTILRFADVWHRQHGVENRFVIYDYPHVTAREMEAKVRALFDPLPGRFEILKTIEALRALPESDVSIATLWSSAYYVARHERAHVRAYFVQDHEPQFYAGGAISGLTEQTYALGLFGLFNSKGLHDHVTRTYGMEGTWFEPAVDHELFHARGRKASGGPARLFFYGRPTVDRNAFELGIEALRRIKARLGDAVEIISAGEAWLPQWFGAEGVVENLGVLPYRETAKLYRSVDVGLCFMFTKHPSYLPLELMASGVAVVTNDNPANAWLLEHEKNCLLTAPLVSSIAAQLERAVTDVALRERVSRGGVARLAQSNWDREASKTFEALSRFCQRSERVERPASAARVSGSA